MTILFNVDYRTAFGEEVVLHLIGADGEVNYRMMTSDGHSWTYRLSLPEDTAPKELRYYYGIERDGHSERHEWTGKTHLLIVSGKEKRCFTVFDQWQDMPEDAYLYTSAFTDCMNSHRQHAFRPADFRRTVRLVVRAPQLRTGDRLALVGSHQAIGAWDASKAIAMTEQDDNEWAVDLDASQFSYGLLEFKFLSVSSEDSDDVMWEDGYNRELRLPAIDDGQTAVFGLRQATFQIYPAKAAGTLVPVFSLRSEGDFGVGDFGDLKLMVDFMAATGQRVLQILPVGDTTTTHSWTDSYPYSCISVFALHPLYTDLRQLPELKDDAQRAHFEQLRQRLNSLPQVDYEQVIQAKISYLQQLFRQEGRHTMETRAYRQFFKEEAQWLVPYAQYCTLRDRYGTADFSRWSDHQLWDEADRRSLENPRTKEYHAVSFWYYVQFVLHTQLLGAHTYAREKHVVLMGDIPIGVNRHGADVWTEPRYFNLDSQAGAPPDAFSTTGQNWGFPTYNWPAMLSDHCSWWTRRLQHMQRYFDAYRIDHVLGFFRIWEIPAECVDGLLGEFSPALGMTPEEINGYGLKFDEALMTKPFITDWVLDRVFKERASLVRDKYLDRTDGEHYRMKPAYDTQRKVWQAFAGAIDDRDVQLRDGLCSLIGDVLFLPDRHAAGKFHPRISAQFSFIYESLSDHDKQVFNRLYDDFFYRRHNQFWYGEAMKKLPILVASTRMLVCAEDLGMVPQCVPWVLDALRILSLEIQTMPKESGMRFAYLSRYPYRSVCTFSTHDMPTLRQWWDEDNERTQAYYNTMLYRQGAAPHPLPGWLARDILSRQLTSPSMLCILSIQDWLAMDEKLRLPDENAERINIPADSHHYWRYRLHVSIERLLADDSFTQNIKDLVSESGR